MGKGRRLRGERAVVRRVAPEQSAGSAEWTDIETLLAPGYGPFPPTRVAREVDVRSPHPAAVRASAPGRRARRARQCVELSRLAAERDELRGRLAEAEAAIVAQVVRERRAGASWGDVGRALGMSRQGARQRFGPE